MSRWDKTVRIRWGAVFEPLCWLLGHRDVKVLAATAYDRSGKSCRRCGRFAPYPVKHWGSTS